MVKVNIAKAGYDNNEATISNIQFSVRKGEIVGLIGSNGAGKSTTIKSIIGTIPYLDGSVEFEAGAIQTYIPEHPVFYDYLTFREHLKLTAALYNIPENEWTERANSLLKLFNLEAFLDEYPANFSKGMQQKSMIIFSFLTKSDFFLIDEPFIGLDPKATKDLLSLILAEKARGAYILMSTHVLDTAERYCDRFVLIDHGRMLFEGDMNEFRNRAGLAEGTLLDCFYKIQGVEECRQ